jgi:hypothetical protein
VVVHLEHGLADWSQVAEIIEDAYRMVAPTGLLTLLDSP